MHTIAQNLCICWAIFSFEYDVETNIQNGPIWSHWSVIVVVGEDLKMQIR